jgi:hypothetical protein
LPLWQARQAVPHHTHPYQLQALEQCSTTSESHIKSAQGCWHEAANVPAGTMQVQCRYNCLLAHHQEHAALSRSCAAKSFYGSDHCPLTESVRHV